jgi:NAD(P)-dependent dehydrogenase (short-subunit alcohol dehydrogenase family)
MIPRYYYFKMSPIENTTILVIGGSSGIGYGVAEKALAERAAVHIASSNASRVQESTKSLQQRFPDAQIFGHVCDLAGPDVEKSLECLLTTVGPLDHIVFTAADRLAIQPLDAIDLDAIHRAGHIRFAVPLLLAKLAPRFVNPGYRSSITLTTGAASQKPIPNWSLIAGYLTGLHGLTQNLALDLKPMRVNLVSPGAVATPLWGSAGVPEGLKNSTTLGKIGTAEEVAEAYIYLMKDTNATGSCVSTNAGSLLL